MGCGGLFGPAEANMPSATEGAAIPSLSARAQGTPAGTSVTVQGIDPSNQRRRRRLALRLPRGGVALPDCIGSEGAGLGGRVKSAQSMSSG